MQRTLPTLAIITVLGVLAWMGLGGARSDPKGDPVVRDDPESASEASAEAKLARVSGPQLGNREVSRSGLWIIEVVSGKAGGDAPVVLAAALADQDGFPPADARLTGENHTVWDSVPAGTWRLTASQGNETVWEQDVFVAAGRDTRTLIQLARPIPVEGTVHSVFGDPKPEHFVGFVRATEPLPTSAIEWLQLPHARTSGSGKFRAELPGPGSYRAFVGYGGKILVSDRAGQPVSRTSPAFIQATVPAPTRLLIELREEKGERLPVGYGVSVYRSKEILDVLRPIPELPPQGPLPDPTDPSLTEDERREMVAILEELKKPVDKTAAAKRSAVVPEGFRVDRSAMVGEDGTLLLTGLPVGEELRFAVLRGGETLRVPGSARVDALQVTRVTITLPPPLPAGTAPTATPREAALGSTLALPESVVGPPGLRWK